MFFILNISSFTCSMSSGIIPKQHSTRSLFIVFVFAGLTFVPVAAMVFNISASNPTLSYAINFMTILGRSFSLQKACIILDEAFCESVVFEYISLHSMLCIEYLFAPVLYAIISSLGTGWQHLANLIIGFATFLISTTLPPNSSITSFFLLIAPIGTFSVCLINCMIFDFAFVVFTILSQSLLGLGDFAVNIFIMSPFFNSCLSGTILPLTTDPMHLSPMLVCIA